MQRIVLTNARLLDGDKPARDKATIVIKGDRLERVVTGPWSDGNSTDQVYDLLGRTVMPGMVIGHYHATYTGYSAATVLPVGMEAPPAVQTIRAVNHLKLALHAGFTGVVSAGAPYAIDAACKDAINQGLIEGPRMVAGSRDVSTTGHSQDGFAWYWGEGTSAQTNIVDGADNFRRAVREEIKRGAEMIKVFATAGHGTFGPSPGLELTEEELGAAIDAAHQRGARIRAHIAHRGAILTAVRLGLDVVDHGDGLDQECIDRMLEKGTFLVPSMFYPFRVSQVASGPQIDAMKKDMYEMYKILPVANRAGLAMTLGDDHGAQPLDHGNYADELEFYVKEVGIPPLDVIRWATKFGGELMGRGHELGTITEGKLADLLVVDGDPVKDIALLRSQDKLLAVMKGGKFVRSRLTQSETLNAGVRRLAPA
jgi:imidazolonepropionase-like amidohydrolase